MSAHQAEFPITTMARVLCVSVSGFYAWRGRPASAHATSDMALLRRKGKGDKAGQPAAAAWRRRWRGRRTRGLVESRGTTRSRDAALC